MPNNFPYEFNSDSCQTCGGKCCRGFGGYIWLNMEELREIAASRKMAVAIFSRQYIRQVKGRLSLQERVVNGEHFCCFFDIFDRRCTIYPNRPEQCRTFPFWNQFRQEPQKIFLECPGVFSRSAGPAENVDL